MRPRTTVIVTVYKRTEYLAGALASVLAQAYSEFEVIVADDSGTGAAREIVATHERDGRVKYIPNSATLGIAASLKGAMESAQGKFIAILNDDDTWNENLLSSLIPPLEADSERVLAFCDHWVMREDGRIDDATSENWSKEFGRQALPEGALRSPAEAAVLHRAVPVNLAAAWRKDAFDLSLLVSEVAGAYDYFIGCVLAATGRPFYYVAKRLACWRVHEAMETKRRGHDKGENMVYIYQLLRERGWFPELESQLREELSAALVAVGRDKMAFGRAPEARKCFWSAFWLSGGSRNFFRAVASLLPQSIRRAAPSHLNDSPNRSNLTSEIELL